MYSSHANPMGKKYGLTLSMNLDTSDHAYGHFRSIAHWSHKNSFCITCTGSQGTQMGTIRSIVTHFMTKRATFLGSHEYHANALCDLETEVKVMVLHGMEDFC